MQNTNYPPRRRLRTLGAARGARVLAGALTVAAVGATAAASTTAAAAATTTPTSSPLTVLKADRGLPSGDLFVTLGSTAYILTKSGNVVWSQTAPSGGSFADLQEQTYEGKPVITFSESTNGANGQGASGGASGTDYILNSKFQQIATVEPGAGYNFDIHEFRITPQGTAWITATQESTADLTSIGGPADQAVTNGIAQEIDIKTGKVLETWNSADHVPYSDSNVPLPASASQPWDWFHINAVDAGPNGSILIDSRHTWSFYDVNPRTLKTNFTVGGKASSFTQLAAPGQTLNAGNSLFAWQHEPTYIGDNRYWIFDDESDGSVSDLPASRAVEVQVNPFTRTATVIASRNQPEGLEATATGGVQPLANGDLLVGWGTLPYVSIYNRAGKLIYNAEYTSGTSSYRAFLFNLPPAGRHRR